MSRMHFTAGKEATPRDRRRSILGVIISVWLNPSPRISGRKSSTIIISTDLTPLGAGGGGGAGSKTPLMQSPPVIVDGVGCRKHFPSFWFRVNAVHLLDEAHAAQQAAGSVKWSVLNARANGMHPF